MDVLSAAHGPLRPVVRSAVAIRAALGTLATLLAGVLGAACGSSGVEPPAPGGATPAEVERLVDSAARRIGAPGVVVGVRVGSASPFVIVRGVANAQTGAPLVPNDRFRVGSVTKTMVATVVVQLADERRLALDDTIARWLPAVVPGADRITVRQLLNHTSGLPDYTATSAFDSLVATDPARPRPPAELLALAARQPPPFAPGARDRWAYSNTNYVVLGLLVERVTGRALAAVLHDRIFAPLGMADSYLATTTETPPPFSRGYLRVPGGPDVDVASLVSPTLAWAAGAVVSTAPDLLRWADALAAGTLVSPAAHRERLTPVLASGATGYGLGIEHAGSWIGHDGATFGYEALVFTRPGVGSIVVLTNRSSVTIDASAELFDAVRWAVFGSR